MNAHLNFLPGTHDRVHQNTSDEMNERLRREMVFNLAKAEAGGTRAIEQRLRELDREWDIERALETNASVVFLTGLALGAFVDKRWLAFCGVAAGFLLQHALQGWCPPLPLMRRLGIRTASEIEEEREALRVLRGDFHPASSAADALSQVRSGRHNGHS